MWLVRKDAGRCEEPLPAFKVPGANPSTAILVDTESDVMPPQILQEALFRSRPRNAKAQTALPPYRQLAGIPDASDVILGGELEAMLQSTTPATKSGGRSLRTCAKRVLRSLVPA